MEYRKARPEEEEQLLDFINLVFSQAHEPHDFAALLPKVYAHPGFSRYHLVAAEQGSILATVAMLPLTLRVEEGVMLRCGYVGSVSVHPRKRGAGHMRRLMAMTLEEAKAQGMDFVALGGQRQRYAYYGFERGGEKLEFMVNGANIRHAVQAAGDLCLREITDRQDRAIAFLCRLTAVQPMTCVRKENDFYDIMRSWHGRYYALERDGEILGGLYAIGDEITELVLAEENLCEQAVAAWLQRQERCTVRVPACNRVRANCLKRFSENYTVSDAAMYRVLNWQRVLENCLSFKSSYQPLCDGEFIFEVEGEGRYRIRVQDHAPKVLPCADAPQMVCTPQKAVEFFLSPYTALETVSPMLRSWLPLPLGIPAADGF